jgi:threonine dehydratase
LLHGFNDERVIAGQGTIGLELLDQIPDLGMVVASIGGGGLAAGVALALKSMRADVKVIGVQSTAYPAMHHSVRNHSLIGAAAGYTIADGIAIKVPSATTFEIIEKHVDEIVLVDEDEIASSVMNLMEWEHMLAEGAGAAAVAALWKLNPQDIHNLNNRPIVCIISGGNIDVNLLKRIIPNGLKHSGRLFRLAVRIQDRPGRLAELLNIVSKAGANLQDVSHNRLFNAIGFDDVEVILDLETIDSQHQETVMESLSNHQFKFKKLD